MLEELTDRACVMGKPPGMSLSEFIDWLRGLFPELYTKDGPERYRESHPEIYRRVIEERRRLARAAGSPESEHGQETVRQPTA